jgi:hypothetical protein
MARGRSDYWYGMLPGKAAMGVGQTEWYISGDVAVAASGSEYAIDYTVPVGYRLNITGMLVTCSAPGNQAFSVYLGGVSISTFYFDKSLLSPFNPGGGYVLEAGEKIEVNCYNLDNVSITFTVTIVGFEEYIID